MSTTPHYQQLLEAMDNRVQRISGAMPVLSAPPNETPSQARARAAAVQELLRDIFELGELLDQAHDEPEYVAFVQGATPEQSAQHPVSQMLVFWWQSVFFAGLATSKSRSSMADLARRVISS